MDSLAGTLNLATPWRRRDATPDADAESREVLRETRELFKGAAGKGDSCFFAASEPGLARPMLEAAATPLLRALEGAFAAAEDGAHAALPLEGARAALRLSAQLQLPVGPGSCCSALFSKCMSITWRAMGLADVARRVIGCHST